MRTGLDRSAALIPGLAALVLLIVPAIGCGGGESYEPADAPAETSEVEAPADPEPGLEAKLALADEVDGTADKVVSRCPACGLGMDGSPDHALTVAGYELHFCSEGCRDGFAEDPEAKILALAIPEG